jgi:hypothetical protein
MSPARFDRRMVDALADYRAKPKEFQRRTVLIHELRSGMILEKDVSSNDGNLLILKEGTVLTETWIERSANFAKCRAVAASVPVRAPSLTSLGNVAPRR